METSTIVADSVYTKLITFFNLAKNNTCTEKKGAKRQKETETID
jgi:hypothetical protein